MPLNIEAIRDAVGSGDTAKALDALETYFREDAGAPPFLNELLLLKNRWMKYWVDYTGGLGPDPAIPNVVTKGVLDLLSRLENPGQSEASGLPPKFVVVYDLADAERCQLLNRHLNVLKMTEKIRVYNVHENRFGGEVVADARRELADANYILALVTVNLFNSPGWFALLEEQRRNGRRIIPVRLEMGGGFEDTALAKLSALPSLGRTAADFPSLDAAYADIVAGIRKLL